MKDKNMINQIQLCDNAFRAAVSGSAEEFKKALRKIKTKLKEEEIVNVPFVPFYAKASIGEEANYMVTLRMVQTILVVKGDIRKLDILTEIISDRQFTADSRNRISELLLISCVRDDDEMIRRVLERTITDQQIYSNLFFENPLYVLFLFGKKNFISSFMDRFLNDFENQDTGIHTFYHSYNLMCFNDFLTLAECSYREEISECLFGHRTELPISIIPVIAKCPEILEYLIRNKYECFGFKDRKEPPGFDEFLRRKNPVYDEELIIKVLYEIHSHSDEKTFNRFLEECYPISTIKLSNLNMMNIDTDIIQNELSKNVINKLFAPEVTVRLIDIFDLDFLFKAERLLEGHSISYDLTEIYLEDAPEKESEDEDILMLSYSLLTIGLTESLNFLKKAKNIPHITSLCSMIKRFLLFDSKPLTKLMISKGMVNSDNISEVIAFASEKKLYKALCEISHMNYKGDK